MLVELAVTDLGVIADLSLVLSPGTTALTGETGAGKTLVVTAIDLLVGGRADPSVVRPGAGEARVEGRFVDAAGEEVVLARVVPAEGRSRAYVDGRLAPVAALAERGAALVDLHGQHAHQSLLAPATQRAALDRFGGVDLSPLVAAKARLAEVDAALAALGGDARARARELDLLRFQVDELDRAALDDPDEEARLAEEEELLAGAAASREAAATAHDALLEDGGAADALATALAAVAGRAPFADIESRLRSAAAEIAEAGADVRAAGEAIADDPERQEELRTRRQLLRELRRKYAAYVASGQHSTVADVMAYADEARARLAELESWDTRAATLDAERAEAQRAVAAAAKKVGAARRAAAPRLAKAVQAHLAELAMPKARIEVAVGDDDPGDDVTFLLAANPGEAMLPLARTASGGELARAMLALRLVLTGDEPRTLVFDEVDAGIGGEAAVAVGRALAELGDAHQVLVVTHLPQVAAAAGAQVAVAKTERKGRTIASARPLGDDERVVELSRMLSGSPESKTARGHAEELLATARKRAS